MTALSAPERSSSRALLPGGRYAAVLGAGLLAVCNAITSWVLSRGDLETTADYIALADAHRSLVLVADGLGLFAALLLVPGIWAVAQRLGEATPKLAAVGGWLAASGYVACLVLVVESQIGLAIAATGGDASTYVDAVDNHGSVVQLMIYFIFGLGGLFGPMVLGAAMLRQRQNYPTWAGLVLLLSPLVRMAGLATGVFFLPAVASVMLAVGFGCVFWARRV